MGALDTLAVNGVEASGVDLTVGVVSEGDTALISDTATLGTGSEFSIIID